MIIDLEVVLKEFLYPADLVKTQTICIHELAEMVMVNKNKKQVFIAFQIIRPSLENLNNN